MNVLVTGSTGLVGSALVTRLRADGCHVKTLVRRPVKENEMRWYPEQGILHHNQLLGFDAVVHLAGENIAQGRWTAEKKRRLRESRTVTTQLLAEAFSQVPTPPKVIISASAIGYYGNRGDEVLTETSPAGTGFLADLCRDWEAATAPMAARGIRVVNLRIGVVLTKTGGALAKMLLPFRLGIAGVMGSGNQYWSWITLDDLVSVIRFCLDKEVLRGPVNAVSPQPVTNRVFTKALGRALQRPTLIPTPAFAARLLLGEMADELLLASNRVIPEQLTNAGFPFRDADIDTALGHCLRSN